MISYSLKINGTYYDCEIGATVVKDATEQFDSGTIVIKNSTVSSPFTEADDVNLTIGISGSYDQEFDNSNDFANWTLGNATLDNSQSVPYINLPSNSSAINKVSVATSLAVDTTYTLLINVLSNTMTSNIKFSSLFSSSVFNLLAGYEGTVATTFTTDFSGTNTFEISELSSTDGEEIVFRAILIEGDYEDYFYTLQEADFISVVETWLNVTTYTPSGREYGLILQADKVERVNATKYDHTLTLTEETAKLVKSYSVDRYFDLNEGALFTHQEILDRVRTTTPLGKTALYTIASATQTELGTNSPQKKFEGLNQFQIAVDVMRGIKAVPRLANGCLLYTSPSPRDRTRSRMPSSA